MADKKVEKYKAASSDGRCTSVPAGERDIVSALRQVGAVGGNITACNLERTPIYTDTEKNYAGTFESFPGASITVQQTFTEAGDLMGATAEIAYDATVKKSDIEALRELMRASGLDKL